MSNKLGNSIPIVFAVNNNYVPYLYIAITSLVEYANAETQYQIYILYTSLENRHIKRLENLGKNNIQVNCLNIEKSMEGVNIKGSVHLTVETCFRLLIAEIFPQYPRVIYIDSDTLLRGDIAELYCCELGGKTVGAVHDVVCTYLKEYYANHINMNVTDGFNAGILIIDTVKFRENNIKEKCMELLIEDSKKENRKYIYMDQDVLNRTLKGEVCFLDSIWNFQWQYLWRLDIVYPDYQEKYIKDSQKAKIIHYAGDKKPWQRPDLEKADLFWEMARKTIYYEEILFENLKQKEEKINIFSKYLFPFFKIPQKSKIILYGAGRVGRTLYKQNKVINYITIILWVDRNYKKLTDKIDAVYGIDDLLSYPPLYDYILIAIEDERICDKVRQFLIENGIPKEKIVWDKYIRN